jgi:hypothetical protein
MSLRKKAKPDEVFAEKFPPERMYRLANVTNQCIVSLTALMNDFSTSQGRPIPKPPPDATNPNVGL